MACISLEAVMHEDFGLDGLDFLGLGPVMCSFPFLFSGCCGAS